LARLQEELKVVSIKDEAKIKKVKKLQEKITVRTVKFEGDSISISISAEKSDHMLSQLTEADLLTEARLELEIFDNQLKIDSKF
jgi:hypothetical protein